MVCLALFLASQARSAAAQTVEGIVLFRGEIPKSAVADDAGVHRELLHIDRVTGGLQNVVVWLTTQKPTAAETNPRAATNAVLMDQRDHEFVPRVLAVRAGQPVKFSNSDAANHNVRTSSSQRTNEFNVFTGSDGSYTHQFATDARQRPVRVGCDIHPWMRGWIYVFDHRGSR
jgi:plastocyanin